MNKLNLFSIILVIIIFGFIAFDIMSESKSVSHVVETEFSSGNLSLSLIKNSIPDVESDEMLKWSVQFTTEGNTIVLGLDLKRKENDYEIVKPFYINMKKNATLFEIVSKDQISFDEKFCFGLKDPKSFKIIFPTNKIKIKKGIEFISQIKYDLDKTTVAHSHF
jgi:hypothetical protein